MIYSKRTFGQYTIIPDTSFEQALIDLGFDSGVPNGYVATSSIDTVTVLSISGRGISDLAGIEAFVNLKWLAVQSNQLTSLNISQNPDLEMLNCSYNFITSLDVYQNINLMVLGCFWNQLSSLNLTQNVNLVELDFSLNSITSLDISNCPNINFFNGSDNNLLCLNLKNGNNSSINIIGAPNNPNLYCVEVDDPSWSAVNWPSSAFDSGVTFSTACVNPCILGVSNKEEVRGIEIYPNPFKDELTLYLPNVKPNSVVTLYNILGEKFKQVEIVEKTYLLPTYEFPSGVYFLSITDSFGVYYVSKIIKR